jgi:YD repeat-containing protein
MKEGTDTPRNKIIGSCFLIFFCSIFFRSAAQGGSEPQDIGISPYKEYSSFLPIEMNDTMTGNQVLVFPLFILPQKGGWNLKLSLTYNSMKNNSGPTYIYAPGQTAPKDKTPLGGNWDLHLGRLERHASIPSIGTYFVAEMPDGSRQVLYPKDSYWRSKDNWTVKTPSRETAVLYAPDGMKYVFALGDSGGVTAGILIKIEDPSGNAVAIDYVSQCCPAESCTGESMTGINKITDTCGRVISFKYSFNQVGLSSRLYACNYTLDQVRAFAPDGQTLICAYDFTYSSLFAPYSSTSSFKYKWLKSFKNVEQGLEWKFSYCQRSDSSQRQTWTTYEISEVTTPTLAKILYTYVDTTITQCGTDCYNSRPIQSKVVMGYQNDCPQSAWTYNWDYYPKITCPLNKREEYHYALLGGYLLSKSIYENNVLVQSEEYGWQNKVICSSDPNDPLTPVYKPILVSKKIKRGSNGSKVYTTTYGDFDNYDRPRTIQEIGDKTRTINRTYWANESLCMIDEKYVATESITVDGATYSNKYEYCDNNGKLSSKTLSKVMTTYTYDANGNLTEEQDANGHETRYGNYSNGLPRDISYGTMNDGATKLPGYYTEHREYSWHGNVLSFQDGENHLNTYSYDSLGRLKTVTPPAGAQTLITYAPHGAYMLTQKVSSGAVIDSLYQLYNSLGKPSGAYDPDSKVCTDIQYDPLGRKAFESYPYLGPRTITDRVPSN